MSTSENRFFFLLGGLLVALLVAPVTTEYYPGISQLMLTVTLLVAVSSMAASKHMYRAAWSLVAAKIVLDIVAYAEPLAWISIAEAVVMFTFFALAAVFAFRRVLEGDDVDMNRIAGAISIYMLIGLIWASLYFFLSLMDPQAFKGVSDLGFGEAKLLNAAYMDLLYYSYVTLSTLGYGDVTPVSRAAQSLAYLEAISGVMYVAVLVAALVGSYRSKRDSQA
jgi:voltage-gated potassium channel